MEKYHNSSTRSFRGKTPDKLMHGNTDKRTNRLSALIQKVLQEFKVNNKELIWHHSAFLIVNSKHAIPSWKQAILITLSIPVNKLLWKDQRMLKPFQANVQFPNPLKTSKTLWFSDISRGYRNAKLTENGLTTSWITILTTEFITIYMAKCFKYT